MIRTLRELEVEPQAIEQPLDLSIPENKMMLAFYLAAPEVENDRRAINVINGMRRAMKEGRFLRKAPYGYVNTLNELGNKCIAPKEPQAEVVRWMFKEVSEGFFSTEQIWEKAKRKLRLKMSKNSFWYILLNPVFCGKIRVPAYQDEEEKLVKGQHESLVSQSLFYQVQDILNRRTRKVRKTTIFSPDEIPLRCFLDCPSCNRTLTGSASKGRNQYYHYYHCSSSCGVRYSARTINEDFLSQLRKFKPKLGRAEVFKQVINEAYYNGMRTQVDQKQGIIDQINKENERIAKGRNLLLAGAIEADDLQTIKAESTQAINSLENRLYAIKEEPKIAIDSLLDKALDVVCNIDKLYEEADVESKRKIIGSIYPENLTYSDHTFRTGRMNEAFKLIYQIDSKLGGGKKSTKPNKSALYNKVDPDGLEPSTYRL